MAAFFAVLHGRETTMREKGTQKVAAIIYETARCLVGVKHGNGKKVLLNIQNYRKREYKLRRLRSGVASSIFILKKIDKRNGDLMCAENTGMSSHNCTLENVTCTM